MRWRHLVVDRSRRVARSGMRPVYQKRRDTVKYVPTAKRSQMSGLLKLGHKDIWLGTGNIQYTTQTRPTWMPGKMSAQMTAKMVIASAKRLMAVRQRCRK